MALFDRKKKLAEQENVLAQNVIPEEAHEDSPIEAVVENPTEDAAALDIESAKDTMQSSSVLLETQQTEFPSAPLNAILTEDAPEKILPTSRITESPVEQKIHVLMDKPINGWYHIDSASKNGMPIRLSEKPEGDGTIAFWKRTRAFNAKRWQETGKWEDFITGGAIPFGPKFWRPRFD